MSGHTQSRIANKETSTCVTYSFTEPRVVSNLYIARHIAFHHNFTRLHNNKQHQILDRKVV